MDVDTPVPRNYRGVAPADRIESRRARLIEAAIQVYGAVGFRHATVRAVCTAAALSDRYFYEAFANPECLLAAAFDQVTAEVLSEVARAGDLDTREGVGRARSMLAAYFAALRREKARARVFLVEMIGISPATDAVFDAMLTRIAEHIVATLDPDGVGPLHRDPLLARGVASGLMGIAMRWIRGGYTEPLETVTQAALMLCTLGGASAEDR